ncbi:unnamed protein product [Blepharisma stoltei]|uniref:Small nuclear ribonucleoprotein E n=1 Tax=Blepharisma stoltei TaxID=1481888 RepID=A0AAU9K5J8_9CILI|nr:unnamed protein product [Blepharisma stoltei]
MEFPRVAKKMQNMIKPLGLLFGFLRKGVTVQIWLFENTDMRIEGKIIGFDEYMNLVLDDAVEVSVKRNSRRPIGRIMLKGDNLALVRNTQD